MYLENFTSLAQRVSKISSLLHTYEKLEKARNTGRGLLMITDDRENDEKEIDDSDEDFKVDDESDWKKELLVFISNGKDN